MATNATATKPAKAATPKKPARKPLSNTVWIKYHPWMEGVVGHVASWAIHLLILGIGLLAFLAYALGWIKHNSSLPVEPVSLLDPGGGGHPEGSGTQGGDHAPLKEGVQSDKDNPGNTDNPSPPTDRPPLPTDIVKQLQQEFSPEDLRDIEQGPAVAQTFAGLDKDLREKLRDGINPAAGKAGPGTGGGEGTGTGPGKGSGTGPGTKATMTEREKRMLRWTMKFNTRNGEDYLQQLRGLGAILAIPVGPNQFKVVDLAKGPPYQMEDRDLSTIQRIWWIDEARPSVASLMAAMRLPVEPPKVVAFIPPELEDDLAKKELAFKNLKVDDIYETMFDVIPSGGKYDVKVSEEITQEEAKRRGLRR